MEKHDIKNQIGFIAEEQFSHISSHRGKSDKTLIETANKLIEVPKITQGVSGG